MATVKAILFPRKTKRNTYFVKIRVSTTEKSTYVTTGIDIPKKHWDDAASKIKKANPEHAELNLRIQEKILEIQKELLRPSAPAHPSVSPLGFTSSTTFCTKSFKSSIS